MSTAEDERFVQLLEPPIADLGSSAIASAIDEFLEVSSTLLICI